MKDPSCWALEEDKWRKLALLKANLELLDERSITRARGSAFTWAQTPTLVGAKVDVVCRSFSGLFDQRPSQTIALTIQARRSRDALQR